MTTITLEVPDELAAQFKIDAAHWPEFVRNAVEAKLTEQFQHPTGSTRPPIHHEIIAFLASRPAPEQIISFKISDTAQEWLEELLDKNGETELTPEERTELDQYLQFSHVMILLKASAHLVVNERSE